MHEKFRVTVALVSDDPGVRALCRDICGELAPERARVVVGAVERADYFVWDLQPGVHLPEVLIRSHPERHLLLIDRTRLAWLGEQRLDAGMILLKPVTGASLRAFLAHALEPGRAASNGNRREDRHALLESLLQASLRLQEYDQDRDAFLAAASHEFRVPLTAVSGYCGLLLRGAAGDLGPAQREILARMEQSARRLARIASGMQLLSLGRRAPDPHLEPHDIREPIEQAMHECRPFLEDKRIAPALELELPARPLWFERGQIEQVLINLLENACREAQAYGSIRIRGYPWFWERRRKLGGHTGPDRRSASDQDPNAYRIDVFDDGPPIPDEDLSRIFETFVTLCVRGPGSGLGLAICRGILDRHEGSIWAEPSPGGKRFCFVLPFRQEAFAPEGRPMQQARAVST